MLPAPNKHPGFHPTPAGGPPGPHLVAFTFLAGLAAIAVGLALYALASTQLGLGPRLAPVAYLSLALVAVMLLGSFAATLFRNEIAAGLALLVFWALVFCGAFVAWQLLGR